MTRRPPRARLGTSVFQKTRSKPPFLRDAAHSTPSDQPSIIVTFHFPPSMLVIAAALDADVDFARHCEYGPPSAPPQHQPPIVLVPGERDNQFRPSTLKPIRTFIASTEVIIHHAVVAPSSHHLEESRSNGRATTMRPTICRPCFAVVPIQGLGYAGRTDFTRTGHLDTPSL
ncbi:hypothetical protein BST61_g6903 [Cercospora zeina]